MAYTAGLGCELPCGLRLPRIYAIDELGTGRAAIWMEDIRQASGRVWEATGSRTRPGYSANWPLGDNHPTCGRYTTLPDGWPARTAACG